MVKSSLLILFIFSFLFLTEVFAIPWWEVFFTEGREIKEGKSLIVKKIIKLIEEVPNNGSIYLAIYNFTQKDILKALNKASKRGVKIKAIFDQDCRYKDPGPLSLADSIIWGVEKEDKDEMHHKFAIFNERCILTGGANWSNKGISLHDDNIVIIYDPILVSNYKSEFMEMWGDGVKKSGEVLSGNFKEDKRNKIINIHTFNNCQIENYFACGKDLKRPKEAIYNHLINTKESVFFLAYVFTTSLKLHEVLIDLFNRGKIVEGIFDFKTSKYKHSAYKVLKDTLMDVRLKEKEGLMHAKVFIIDQEILITGSYNWTYSAENKNDENILIIKNPAFGREYVKKFKNLLVNSIDEEPAAKNPHRFLSLPKVEGFKAIPDKGFIKCIWRKFSNPNFSRYYIFLSQNPIKSNFDIGDGIDNDNDGQIDEDPMGDFNEDGDFDDDWDNNIDEDRNLRPVKVIKDININSTSIYSEELFREIPLKVGKEYYLAIVAVDKWGNESFVNTFGPVKIKERDSLNLYNFPNPFSLKRDRYTTIRYYLPKDCSIISLKLYNMCGELIREWRREKKNKGIFEDILWDGKNREDSLVSSGIYLFLIQVDYEDGDKEIKIFKTCFLR